MPSFEKSPADLVARFDAVAARFPEAERRKMFGYPSLFVGGNLVTGVHKSSWLVRLPADEIAQLLATPGAQRFEPMPGRPMKGYALLAPADIDDDGAIDGWVRRTIEYGRTLPPKAAKARRG
jgi:TfoX/Sxy family transcriptional regulator of competence genes